MKNILTKSLATGAVLLLTVGNANADANTDKVVAEMAKGNVSKICKGGKGAITAASTKATTSLAKSGKIKGHFKAIGGKAGTAFYKAKCM